MKLTVAIPTFNRNQRLLDTVKRVLPQLDKIHNKCNLLIIDNASDIPVSETLQSLLTDFPKVEVKIIRNKVNIGACGNFLRCFELCTTEWFWLLSDDDLVMANAIEVIFKNIETYPEAIFINFLSNTQLKLCRPETRLTKGIDHLVEEIDSFTNFNFISVGVYRMDAIINQLKHGYLIPTFPYVAMLFVALGEQGTCCLSNEQIVEWQPPDKDQGTVLVNFYLTGMLLLDLPLKSTTRIKLARKVIISVANIERAIYELLLEARKTGDYQSSQYLYQQIRYRYYFYDNNLKRKLKMLIYTMLFHFPFLSKSLIEFILFRGKKVLEEPPEDRFQRL